MYIYVFHFTSEIKAIFNKNHLNFLFIIQTFQEKGRPTFHFFQAISFLALFLDNEHESMLKATNKMFLIQFRFLCYKIIQRHKSSDFIGV